MEENKDKKITKKEETVVVNKTVLEDILKKIKDQDTQIQTLTAVADKSRLAWYEEKQGQKKQLSQVSIAYFPTEKGMKAVIGWTNLTVNEMYQDTNGNWHERQIMELVFADNTKIQVNYIDFVRRKKSQKANILSRFTDEQSGDQFLKVETIESKEKFDVGLQFVNV